MFEDTYSTENMLKIYENTDRNFVFGNLKLNCLEAEFLCQSHIKHSSDTTWQIIEGSLWSN